MAILIIQTNEDGTAMVAAPAQVPPELLQDAVPAANLEEAMELAKGALGQTEGAEGADQAGGMEGGGEEGGEAAPGMGQEATSTETAPAQGMPREDEQDMDEEERQMQGGFRNAAKGR